METRYETYLHTTEALMQFIHQFKQSVYFPAKLRSVTQCDSPAQVLYFSHCGAMTVSIEVSPLLILLHSARPLLGEK